MPIQQEQFILNDITLRVNATDIQVFDQRFTDTYATIRENTTLSMSSTAALATYVVTFAFDLDNNEDKDNLIKASAELAKYPFVFIKSQRLDQYIPSVSKTFNSYNIFAVKEWTLKNDSRAKNVVFLTIDLIYFNHVPYVKDFQFITYENIRKPTNSRVRTPEDKKNIGLKPVDNLYESDIFKDYFYADYINKANKVDLVMKSIHGKQNGSGSADIIFGSPEIVSANGENAERPYKCISSNIEYSGFEDQDIIFLSYANNHRTAKGNKEDQLMNYWLYYRDMPITLVTDNQGQRVFDVQSISITKKNNIIANQLQMYREPFIQYLGNNPSVMTIDISINNSNFEYDGYQDDDLKPYEVFATELRKGESFKVVGGNKMPFKSLRVRSLLNVLADATYFIIDNESSLESSEDRGRQGITLNLVESDIIRLIGSNNLNLSSQALKQRDMYPSILVAAELLQSYAETNTGKKNQTGATGGIVPKDKLSNLVSDKLRPEVNANKGVRPDVESYNLENMNLIRDVNSIVSLQLGERNTILTSGLNGKTNIHSIVAFLLVQTDKFLKTIPGAPRQTYTNYNDALLKASKALKAIANAAIQENKKLDTNTQEFIEFFGAIMLSIETLLKKNYKDGFIYVEGADSENSLVYTKVLMSAFSNLSIKTMKLGFNEINGEALADLELYKSLLSGYNLRNSSQGNDYLGETDMRKFSPFFFLNQETYLDSTGLMAISTAVSTIAGPELEKSDYLFNQDGKTITDYGKYIPLYEEDELKAENSKVKPPKPAPYDGAVLKNRLEQIAKMTDVAYAQYLEFKKVQQNNPKYKDALSKFEITKDLLYVMIAIESGGNPNAHRGGSIYYGLLQISRDNWNNHASYLPFSKWNDPAYNTMASLHFWYKDNVPILTGKEAKAIDLNPNSLFNFYMMHQQGATGYLNIVKLYRDQATRSKIVSDLGLRHKMKENFPGQNTARTAWDYRPDTWMEAWKNVFFKKTGMESQLFGYTEPNKAMMVSPVKALELTNGIGAPANVKRLAKIYPADGSSKVNVEDGDTFSFDKADSTISFKKGSFIIEGDYKGDKLRLEGIDTTESRHEGHPIYGQKYGIDATRIAEDVLSKMKYPIYIFSNGTDVYGRPLSIVVDSNGADFSYEMLKNGVSTHNPMTDPELKQRNALYNKVYESTRSLLKVDSQDTPREGRFVTVGGAAADTRLDIQELEQQIAVATANGPRDMTVLERSTALLAGHKEEYEYRPADGLLTRKPLTAIKPLQIDRDKTAIEFDEDINTQYRCMRTGNHISTGLDLSVPAVKIYVVEGLRDDWFARYHIAPPRETNLYEVKGITDVRVQTPTEDNPVSVAAFTILNPGSIYTDLAAIARRGGGAFSTYDQNNLDANYFDKIGKLRLTAGTRIHIRMGYSNNPNELETVFNGEIVEVEGEDVLNIIAEGYGRELIALDQSVEDVTTITAKSVSTNLAIHHLLQADEIYHLGLKAHVKNSANPVGRNILDGTTIDTVDSASLPHVWKSIYAWMTKDDPNGLWFGDWWALSSELFTNVYSPIIQAIDPAMSGDIRFLQAFSTKYATTLAFPIYKMTTWEGLREVQYRHPGTYMNVMNYKERGSFFFGIKEQMYIATDPPLSMFTGATESFETYNAQVNSIKHKIIKPATDMHLITSERDIIFNQLKLNGGFKTKVDVRYFDRTPSVDGMETGSGFHYYSMQLDDNLRPNAIRSTTLDAKACDHMFMAWRYGTSELQRQAERMYDGQIAIVGNPYMKAGDYAYLSDSFRGLNGVIKIRECSHIINDKDGYITVITPGLFVESRIYKYSNLYAKLALAWTMAANRIKADASSGFYDTRKIKYTTSFFEILTNKELAEKLFSVPLDEGSRGAAIGYAALNAAPGVIGAGALYMAFPWITRQVLAVSATLASSTTAATVVGTVRALGVVGGGLARGTLAAGIQGGGLLGTISRVALATMDGVTAGVASGVRIAAMVASSTALVTAGVFVVGAGILALYLYQTIEELKQTRQPLVLYPLLNNGVPYQAGLFGYEINTFGESFGTEFNKTMKAISTIMGAARAKYFTATDSTSDVAKVSQVLNYLGTNNKVVSSGAFYGGN